MVFMDELSILFDTLNFCMLSLYEKKYLDFSGVDEIDKLSVFHDCKKNAHIEIDDMLSPFFVYIPKKISCLCEYFFKNINSDNLYNYNFKTLIEQISDKTLFFDHFSNYFFKDIKDIKNLDDYNIHKMLINRIDDYDYDPDFKTRLLYVFLHFDYMIEILKKTLIEVYEITKREFFKKKNLDIINKLIDECKKSEVKKVLSAISNVPFESYNKRPLAISLFLEQSFTYLSSFDIVGIDYNKALLKWGNYRYVTKESFGRMISNEYTSKIYDFLSHSKKNEINATEVAEKFFISPTMAGKYLKKMHRERAAFLSRKTKKSNYYSINHDYYITSAKMVLRVVEENAKLKLTTK